MPSRTLRLIGLALNVVGVALIFMFAYRKGELSKGTIDRDWPHQVALPVERCLGGNYVTIRLFCEGLSPCTRGQPARVVALERSRHVGLTSAILRSEEPS